MDSPFQIEQEAYQVFIRRWARGEFHLLRVGQAFYNEFRLHRMADQESLCGLYEKDGVNAFLEIERIFGVKG